DLYKYALQNSKEILDEYFSDPLLKAVLSVFWGYIGVPPTRSSGAGSMQRPTCSSTRVWPRPTPSSWPPP
ncbi:MAG: hypothetical protein ACERLM_11370, partial [Acidimicrobiales bacterium]